VTVDTNRILPSTRPKDAIIIESIGLYCSAQCEFESTGQTVKQPYQEKSTEGCS
jgi:hypothetical protein